jgi:hypothetical protein
MSGKTPRTRLPTDPEGTILVVNIPLVTGKMVQIHHGTATVIGE